MAQNIGTLVGAAIRPISDTMPIASAFAFEINGGHHQVATLSERDAIIAQRREWGMLCTVYNDAVPSNNATYQLTYGYSSTTATDNANWAVFSVAGGSNANWSAPVLSVTMSAPVSPFDGERYLVGLNSAASLSGSFASLANPGYTGYLVGGYIAEYKDSVANWVTTLPSDGMTIRVNDQDNTFYRYEGTYSTGQWHKERVNQVRYLYASSLNGIEYTIATEDFLGYSTEAVYMIQFATANSGSSATLEINGLGQKNLKKQGVSGLSNLVANDLNVSNIYSLIYDGTNFRVDASESGDSSIKYRIVSGERISVPDYSEYLLYGDLEVNGILDISSTGKVVIINGALNVNGGTVSNSGNVQLVTLFGTSSTVGGVQKYTEVLTPMTMGITYSIAHNLNTTATVITTWDEATGELIIIDAVKTNSNNIDISTTTTLSSVRIVVVG